MPSASWTTGACTLARAKARWAAGRQAVRLLRQLVLDQPGPSARWITAAPDAWAALGVVALYFEWDFPAARERLERALPHDPRAPGIRHAYPDWFVVMGRARESLEEVLLARDLDPDSWQPRLFLPGHLVASRRFEDA